MPGQIVLLAGRLWRNPTAASILVPTTIDLTTLPAAGLEEFAIIATSEVVTGTVNLTGTAPIGARYGRNTVTGAEFDVVGGVWTPAVLPVAVADTYITLPTSAAIGFNHRTRIVPSQSYSLATGTAGAWVDLSVSAGTGVASITATGTNTIAGIAGIYSIAPNSNVRLLFNAVAGDWEVYGVTATATASGSGMEYSNWVTFGASAAKERASGGTFAQFVLARISNTVAMPVEAGLTAQSLSIALGLGVIQPITLVVSGDKPVTLRNLAGSTTYTGSQIIPAGLYAVSYNGTVVILDQLEGAAATAVATTPANLTGKKGYTSRVNAGETAIDLFQSTGSLIGGATSFAALPTTNIDYSPP